MNETPPHNLPFVAVPPTNFNIPISELGEIGLYEFITEIHKTTLHQRPDDPEEEVPPGHLPGDIQYPPASM